MWRDRALGHLCHERPEVRKLLIWLEKQTSGWGSLGLHSAASQFGMPDADSVDYVFFEAIKYIIADSLLGWARSCDEHGAELWRRLQVEWGGSAPKLRHAKARKFQDPKRCPNIMVLWEAWPTWERLGYEIRILNAVVRWTDSGLTYEADPWHVEILA